MSRKGNIFEKLAHFATQFSGSTTAFILALSTIILWLVTGPIFGYSDTWQLVINTGTTVITFIMVFLIQRAQNKDSRALHLKLNELVASHRGASNRLLNVEDLTEEELETLHRFFLNLAEMAALEKKLSSSHSIEEAIVQHNLKYESENPHDSDEDENIDPTRS